MALATRFKENLSEIIYKVESDYPIEIANDILEILEDPLSWDFQQDLSHEEILKIACDAHNEFYPDDDEWLDTPLNVLAKEAFNFGVSVIRHSHSCYDWLLGEIKYVANIPKVPKHLSNLIRDNFTVLIKQAYPDLWAYLEEKYYQDNQ